MLSYIEEDFRFITREEFLQYDENDLATKPNMPGFQLIQLLDQLDGQALCNNQEVFRVFLVAPPGMAFWLAKHMSTYECSNELYVCVQKCKNSESVLNEIEKMPNVARTLYDSDKHSSAELLRLTDCAVLACFAGSLQEWYRHVLQGQRFRRKTILAYDPNRLLKAFGAGRYFMNSKIWVTQDGN